MIKDKEIMIIKKLKAFFLNNIVNNSHLFQDKSFGVVRNCEHGRSSISVSAEIPVSVGHLKLL